jgi:hypothetical protein
LERPKSSTHSRGAHRRNFPSVCTLSSRIEVYAQIIRSLYRVTAKAAKCTSYVVIAQLLIEPALTSVWLPDVLSVIPSIAIREDCLNNPPLILPIVSEALFILNKLMDGMLKMKINLKSDNDLSASCRQFIVCGQQISADIIDRCLAVVNSTSGGCFSDRVSVV